MRSMPIFVTAAVCASLTVALTSCSYGQSDQPLGASALAVEPVVESIEQGQLKAARELLANVDNSTHAAMLRRLIEQRGEAARQLVIRGKSSMQSGDLTAAARALAFAVELDADVLAADAAVEYERRATQVASGIEQARACAAQRNFRCVQEAVEAVRHFDRHNASAMFWALYAEDWRPSSTAAPVSGRQPK